MSRPPEAPAQELNFSLENWYHTIDLGDGLVSQGYWDHRTIVDCYGIPESLAGKTALDVGTADGFWAFELERRGADRVVAIDVETHADFDWLPGRMPPTAPQHRMNANFEIAHARFNSSVEHRTCNVYDLSPETVGEFDIVFCGSLLLHLMNPLQALVNIRSVTKQMAIVESLAEPGLDAIPDVPLLRFGHSDSETVPGEGGIYWRFGRRALEEMFTYAGFARTEAMPPFRMPPNDMEAIAIHGYPTVPSPPPADGEAQRGGLLGSLLRSRRRRRHA
jgi:tRNA (mo5U34)-methyltransferase